LRTPFLTAHAPYLSIVLARSPGVPPPDISAARSSSSVKCFFPPPSFLVQQTVLVLGQGPECSHFAWLQRIRFPHPTPSTIQPPLIRHRSTCLPSSPIVQLQPPQPLPTEQRAAKRRSLSCIPPAPPAGSIASLVGNEPSLSPNPYPIRLLHLAGTLHRSIPPHPRSAYFISAEIFTDPSRRITDPPAQSRRNSSQIHPGVGPGRVSVLI
jgi:hypothetical protein